MLTKGKIIAYIYIILYQTIWSSEQPVPNLLRAIEAIEPKTANTRPVATYETPISNLDFDPRVDMQARNMAEAQGDLSIRGGTFENTGIQVGSATIMDPQTGHYTTELPIAPEMLGEPKVLTGAVNALLGFNSSVGTVSYSWSEMTYGGSLTLGGGDHDLNFQRLHNAWTGSYNDSKDWTWGAEIEGSRSESDGTIPFSDHTFNRTSGRIQFIGPDSQTDLFAGYQHKKFGQYGMYTGDLYTAFNPYEFENIKTRLFLFNHRVDYGNDSLWEVTSYHRRNNDHYYFNRFAPDDRFVHESKVNALSISGLHEFDSQFTISYAIQSASDEIESTALMNGPFTNRNYHKISLLPEYRYEIAKDEDIIFKAGASWEDTNRNKGRVSPIAEISRLKEMNSGRSEKIYISYAESVQFIGYGAIGGIGGLFQSNPNLTKETSRNLEVGYQLENKLWTLHGAAFHRRDDDLADWTYVGTAARSAENLDLETFGVEFLASRDWGSLQVMLSYGYLSKKEDYGNLIIDGSFYALNFPKHRFTLGVIWDPVDSFQIRVDNEWRDQHNNSLRKGPNESLYSHLVASYYPSNLNALEIFLAYDKPWDEDFQDIPGTPGRGDQFSFGVSKSW